LRKEVIWVEKSDKVTEMDILSSSSEKIAMAILMISSGIFEKHTNFVTQKLKTNLRDLY